MLQAQLRLKSYKNKPTNMSLSTRVMMALCTPRRSRRVIHLPDTEVTCIRSLSLAMKIFISPARSLSLAGIRCWVKWLIAQPDRFRLPFWTRDDVSPGTFTLPVHPPVSSPPLLLTYWLRLQLNTRYQTNLSSILVSTHTSHPPFLVGIWLESGWYFKLTWMVF